MDGYIRHRIEGVSVDIEVVPVEPRGYSARFRLFGDTQDEAQWHAVHHTDCVFESIDEAEEAAKSIAFDMIREHQDRMQQR